MNKKNLKLYAMLTVLVFVAVAAIGLAVNAFSGQITNVENFYEASNGQLANNGQLGAVSNPWFPGQPYTCDNQECTWIVTGDCTDSTVDIVAFANPWGVTASTTVVDQVRIRIDGVATTSSIITCGAGTTSGATPTYDLMTSGEIATSTGLGCIMENGLLTADNGDSGCPDGGSIQKISLTEMYPYFNCEVSEGAGKAGTAGITNAANTFDCNYTVRLKQMR